MASQQLRELIAARTPIVFDGAMGTMIQGLGFGADDAEGHPECNEIYNITRPDRIAALHARYFDSGAMVVETNTIGANRIKLAHFGFGERAYEINREAARAARRGAGGRYGRFVCGAIGPTGYVPHADTTDHPLEFDELADIFCEQSRGLLDGGADMLVIETQQVLLEMRAAIVGARRAMDTCRRTVPLQVQGTFDEHGRMLLGADTWALLGAIGNMHPDIIGLNCSTGPSQMIPRVRELRERCALPLAVLPNAGMPGNVEGRAVYDMGPEEFAREVAPMVTEMGVSVVGGCCGTTPEHIAALCEALKGSRCAVRGPASPSCYVGSAIGGCDLEHQSAPVIIGERLNAQGSRKTKELVLARNWDELHAIAREQIDQHSALLDLCVAVNEQDAEAATMAGLVEFLSQRIGSGLCIDTTEPLVLERALKLSAGSVLINSINLEHGGARARRVLALAREFGCPVIALTIDDDGMARSAERKLELARRLAELACAKYGLPEHHLYLDPLVFTLATGSREDAGAAVASLEALRRIRADMPGVRTVMGVSNVSFGLRPGARRVLNNVMLHHATAAGLRAAIYNPAHVDNVASYGPEVRGAAEDLLFDRAPDALARFAALFERLEPAPRTMGAQSVRSAVLSPAQQLRSRILERDRRGLRELVEQALATTPPEVLLNEVLMPAMAEVGERMASGTMILPFVLQAAEVMKEAAAVLEPHLADGRGAPRGNVVLATVYGDVHDIGKNLVATILRNQGFGVVDLGRQVAAQTIVDAVAREHPVALGLSALLVTTSREMATVVRLLAKEGHSVPVLIGGAAVNRTFAQRIEMLEGGVRYAGGVQFCRDAFAAVKVLESADGTPTRTTEAPMAQDQDDQQERPAMHHEPLEAAEPLEPPFFGTSQMLTWDSSTLLDLTDKNALFKGQWRGGNLAADAYEKAVTEQFEPAFRRLCAEIRERELVDARGFYGFFPAITDDQYLVLLDPGDLHTERATFRMPRLPRAGGRSIADYVRAEGDIVAVQAVTLGGAIGRRVRELMQESGEYALGFLLNGLANQLTEELAERATREVRRSLGIERERGRRYSFGYPGLPGVEEQKVLFELLAVEERLGVSLTPGFQMDPEHSTMGLFVHHPLATYATAGAEG